MTTIVYDHKARQIAVDGRVTAGNVIKTETAIKWAMDCDVFWFLTGSVSDEGRFIDYMNTVDPDKPKWEIECSAMMVKDGEVYVCGISSDGDPWKAPTQYSDAMGSGEHWALAALDFGLSAKQAVEYAMTRDCATGGKVSVFDVEKMEFIE